MTYTATARTQPAEPDIPPFPTLMGITGTGDTVSGDASGLVKQICEHTALPAAVGLGVNNGVQAAQVAAFATA